MTLALGSPRSSLAIIGDGTGAASDFLKRPQQPTRNPNPTRPPASLPLTRQLSTPRTAKMLFSVSRASVRRPPDGPGDGPCPFATWCSPVQEGGFSELSANTRVCNHTEPPGRRRSLPTCWPQLRSDEDLPQPHGLAKRYVEQRPALFPPFVITRVRTPVPGAAGRWIGGGGAFDRAGPLEIASRHDLALPARALPSASHVSLPQCFAQYSFSHHQSTTLPSPSSSYTCSDIARPHTTPHLSIPSTHSAF